MTQDTRPWTEVLGEAEASGFVTIRALAADMDMRWDHVLTWVDRTGAELVDLAPRQAKLPEDRRNLSRAARCVLSAYDVGIVKEGYGLFVAEAVEASAASAEAAELERQKWQERKATEKAAQEQRQQEYRERVAQERADAEEGRQERLAEERRKAMQFLDMDFALGQVSQLRRQTDLARRQFESTASPDARLAFFSERIGEQNFEYASTNYRIGRRWARRIWKRYARNLAHAEAILPLVEGGATMAEAEDRLRDTPALQE